MHTANKVNVDISIAHNRLNYLDALRAFALLLGIVFHASLSFLPIFIGWAVVDVSTSQVVAFFAFVSHSFRMELFFLIAGFFSHMTFHRTGIRAFVKTRVMRIAIPFILAWIILRPLILSAWAMGSQSVSGNINFMDSLLVGLQQFVQRPEEFLTNTHLWFLYYLLLSTTIVLSVRLISKGHSYLYKQATRWMDLMVMWIACSRFSWLALSLPTGLCLWFMKDPGVDTPDKSLVPHWPVLIIYCGFFTFGWLLERQPKIIEVFSQLNIWRAALCVTATISAIGFSDYFQITTDEYNVWLRCGAVLAYAIMMWSLVSTSIGLFKYFFDQPNKLVRYLADASYWLYLIHLPIVVWLQVTVAELPFHWSVKLAAISLITIGFSVTVYDLFIRSSLIGKMLNGRKKDRVLFRATRLK